MNRIFVDSSFWIARRDERDTYHHRAEEITRYLAQAKARCVVTPFIFAESHAHFVRSVVLREQVIRDFWENPAVQMAAVTGADQEAALHLLRRQRDKSYSFCDATSFMVMRRLGLKRSVSFDDHFRQLGEFEVVA